MTDEKRERVQLESLQNSWPALTPQERVDGSRKPAMSARVQRGAILKLILDSRPHIHLRTDLAPSS
jgi:hypothetical protein